MKIVVAIVLSLVATLIAVMVTAVLAKGFRDEPEEGVELPEIAPA